MSILGQNGFDAILANLVGNQFVGQFHFFHHIQAGVWRVWRQKIVFIPRSFGSCGYRYFTNSLLVRDMHQLNWLFQFKFQFVYIVTAFCAVFYFIAVISYKSMKDVIKKSRLEIPQLDIVSCLAPVEILEKTVITLKHELVINCVSVAWVDFDFKRVSQSQQTIDNIPIFKYKIPKLYTKIEHEKCLLKKKK